jgi:hypothetical protein
VASIIECIDLGGGGNLLWGLVSLTALYIIVISIVIFSFRLYLERQTKGFKDNGESSQH